MMGKVKVIFFGFSTLSLVYGLKRANRTAPECYSSSFSSFLKVTKHERGLGSSLYTFLFLTHMLV